MIKVALVGAGGMGRTHLKAYSLLEDAKVAAIVDAELDRAENGAKVFGAKAYTSIDEMLVAEKIDMVDICSPTYLHAELAMKAMNKGVNVLCEKPISLTVEAANQMVETARKNNVFFMVAQVIRFFPEYEYLKKVYDERTYGKLNQLMLTRTGSNPRWSWHNWMLDVKKSGRVPIDLHIHDTDYILHLLGQPKALTSIQKDNDSISWIGTNFEYDDVAVNTEAAWYFSPLPFSMAFRAGFENAVVEYKDKKLTVYEKDKKPVVVECEPSIAVDSGTNISSANGYFYEILYFVNCIKNNTPPVQITPEAAVDSLKMVYKELESVKVGRRITI